MLDGNRNTSVFHHGNHFSEFLNLFFCESFIILICFCKMSKNPLHYHMRKLCNLRHLICGFFCHLIPDTAHSGIHCKMHPAVFSNFFGSSRKLFCHLKCKNTWTDFCLDYFLILIREDIAKNQNRFLDSIISKDHPFLNRCSCIPINII